MKEFDEKVIRQTNEILQYYTECFNAIPLDILRIFIAQLGWTIDDNNY